MITHAPDIPRPKAIYPLFGDYEKRAWEALKKGYFTDSIIARYCGVLPQHFRWWRRCALVNAQSTSSLREFFLALNELQAKESFDLQEVHLSSARNNDDPDKIGRTIARYLPDLRDEAADTVEHGIPGTRIEEEYMRAGVVPQELNEDAISQSRAGQGGYGGTGAGGVGARSNHRGPAYSAKQFARKFYTSYCTVEFAAWHSELMEWATAIQYGLPPAEQIVAIVNRDGGKSTIGEIIMAYVMASGRRGYGVYLCGTQSQADDHVMNISGLLQTPALNDEYPGVGEVAVDQNNRKLGWKKTRLTSSLGFTIDAIGIDKQMRGAKIDEKRIDFIIMDDIDSDSDTPYRVETKLEALGRKILPAGSGNLAVLGVQNLITSHSVFARIKDGNSDVIQARVLGPIPAIDDLVTDPPDPINTYSAEGVKIVSGTPTWEGFSLAKAQNVMNLVGIRNFLAEYQHETDVMGGLAFAAHWKKQYVEVELESNPPDGYKIYRVYDYGTTKPWAYYAYAVADGESEVIINGRFATPPKGSVLVLEELYGWTGIPNVGDNSSSADHAQTIIDAEANYTFRNRILVGPADGQIFNNPDNGDNIATIFERAGIEWRRADKSPGSRKAGAEQFRSMLAATHAFCEGRAETDEPCFFVNKTCENLIRTVPNLPSDKRQGKDGDVDTLAEDHPWDCIRYAILDGSNLEEAKLVRG